MRYAKNLIGLIIASTLTIAGSQVYAITLIPTAGKTEVQLSNAMIAELTSLGVKAGAITPGTLSKKGFATFPITTGAVEMTKGEVDHSGGLTLTSKNNRLVLNSFIIDTFASQPILNGLIITNGIIKARAPVFELNTATAQVQAKGKKLTISNVGLTLTREGAILLNQLYGFDPYSEIPVGTATVKITNSRVE